MSITLDAATLLSAAAFLVASAGAILALFERRARLADRSSSDEQFAALWGRGVGPMAAEVKKLVTQLGADETVAEARPPLPRDIARPAAEGLARPAGPLPQFHTEPPEGPAPVSHPVAPGVFEVAVPGPPRVPSIAERAEALPKLHSEPPRAGVTIVGYAPPVPGRWMPGAVRPGIDAAGERGGQ